MREAPYIRQITIRYESHCRTCSQAIKPGEKAWWSPGGVIWHFACDNPPGAERRTGGPVSAGADAAGHQADGLGVASTAPTRVA